MFMTLAAANAVSFNSKLILFRIRCSDSSPKRGFGSKKEEKDPSLLQRKPSSKQPVSAPRKAPGLNSQFEGKPGRSFDVDFEERLENIRRCMQLSSPPRLYQHQCPSTILMFITLLFKLGICQCVVKSICKMSCAACAMYWFAIGEMIRCLWHSLTNTKRVYRRKRLRDIEAASYSYPSDDEPSSADSTRPKQRRRRRTRRRSKHNHNRGSNRRLVRLKSRQMSIRVGGKSRRVRSGRKMKSSRVRVKKKILKVNDLV